VSFDHADLTTDIVAHPLNGTCDLVISTEVVEHLLLPRPFARNCYRFLKPGGRLIISTPYHGYLKNVALALSGSLDAHFTALWDYGHVKFWSRKTLSLLLAEAGFTVEQFHGAGRFPLFWKSMVLIAAKPLVQ
jgi:2-polyprenyl-6-hydroxyphenyl methylase/3-demethylubiquinone-9 3-methyltransferase